MKKHTYRLLSLILVIIISFSACTIRKDAEGQQVDFDVFTNEIFINEVQRDTLTLNYSLANPSYYGIKNAPITLGKFSIEQMTKELSEAENYLNKLQSFQYDKLTKEQQLTYDILKKQLELDLEFQDYLYYTTALGPTTGIQAQLPILLAEYNFYTQKDIDTYLKLLPSVYDYFKDIAEFETEKSKRGLFMSDKVADQIIAQCSAFVEYPDDNFLIHYFNEKIDNYQGLSKSQVVLYQEANRGLVKEYVIPAYEMLIETLESLKGTGINNAGLYYYPNGHSYYEYLAKIKTGSSKTMKQMIDMLEKSMDENLQTMNKISISDGQILDKLSGFEAFPLTDPKSILEELKVAIQKDFPELVDVDYDVKYVHDSLKDYLSPAMYLVPAMDSYENNNIYINGDDEDTLSYIFTTVAHEGYPGHLYQCVYFRSQDPDPIRNVLNFSGYDEGWATYVEHYSYSLAGIDPNLAEFFKANSRILLSMYGRADIGIHYEGWTKDTAVKFINHFVGDESISENIYETLLEEPAVYLPYAIGSLEIEELKEKAENSLAEEFNLKEFHTFLLDIGPAQFEVIDSYMTDYLLNR